MNNQARRLAVMLLLTAAVSSCWGQVATGSYPYGTFDSKGFDTINIGNLNVHFSIPLINKPGRGLSFYYNLGYDSSVWYPTSVNGSLVWEPVPAFGWKGETEMLTGYASYDATTSTYVDDGPGAPAPVHGRFPMCTTTTYDNWVYHDPLGAAHPYLSTTSSYVWSRWLSQLRAKL